MYLKMKTIYRIVRVHILSFVHIHNYMESKNISVLQNSN